MVKGATHLPAIGRPHRCSSIINYVVVGHGWWGTGGTIGGKEIITLCTIVAIVFVVLYTNFRRNISYNFLPRRGSISLQSSSGPIIISCFCWREEKVEKGGLENGYIE